MITFYRAKSVLVVGVPYKPKIEVVVGLGPLRVESSRVDFHINYLKKIEPQHEHRKQTIEYEE